MTFLDTLAPIPADPDTPIFNDLVAEYVLSDLHAARDAARARLNAAAEPADVTDRPFATRIVSALRAARFPVDPDSVEAIYMSPPRPAHDAGRPLLLDIDVDNTTLVQRLHDAVTRDDILTPAQQQEIAEAAAEPAVDAPEPEAGPVGDRGVECDLPNPGPVDLLRTLLPVVNYDYARRQVGWFRSQSEVRAYRPMVTADIDGLWMHDDLPSVFMRAPEDGGWPRLGDVTTLGALGHLLNLAWETVESLRVKDGRHWTLLTHEDGSPIPQAAPPVPAAPIDTPFLPPSPEEMMRAGARPQTISGVTMVEPMPYDPDLVARARAAAEAADAHDAEQDREAAEQFHAVDMRTVAGPVGDDARAADAARGIEVLT